MSLEGRDGRRSNSRTRRLSTSSIMSEEDKSNPGLIGSMMTADGLHPPGTAVIRRTETRCMKTNQTTGLKVAEQSSKNISMMTCVRQQLVSQKECLKMGSVRQITSRGQRDKNFHRIRQFQGVIHSKIRDLALEIEKINWRCNNAQQEYINSLTYESKAKELASEITNYQETLADLNLAFDYVNRIGDIEKIEEEVQQLEELNISERGKIEGMFEERKVKEDFIHHIKNNERVKKILDSSHTVTTPQTEQYIYFSNRLSQSSMAVEFWEKRIEQYKKDKDMLTQKVKTKVPFMDELIPLEIKLLNLKGKCCEVRENSMTSFNKEQEIILETAKQDKVELTQMEYNLKSLTKKINTLQEVLDYLRSSEGEEPNSTEKIDSYLLSFDNNKDKEITKINLLHSEITGYLSNLKNKLSQIPTLNDYLNLNDINIGEVEISDTQDLLEQHIKAFSSLKKMELMESHQTKDCKIINEKSKKIQDDLEEYKSQKILKDKFEIQENELINQILHLEENIRSHLKEQEMARGQLEKLEKEISKNEKHKELLSLEEEDSILKEDIKLMNQMINEMKITTTHLLEIRAKTLNLMELVNSGLINQYE